MPVDIENDGYKLGLSRGMLLFISTFKKTHPSGITNSRGSRQPNARWQRRSLYGSWLLPGPFHQWHRGTHTIVSVYLGSMPQKKKTKKLFPHRVSSVPSLFWWKTVRLLLMPQLKNLLLLLFLFLLLLYYWSSGSLMSSLSFFPHREEITVASLSLLPPSLLSLRTCATTSQTEEEEDPSALPLDFESSFIIIIII